MKSRLAFGAFVALLVSLSTPTFAQDWPGVFDPTVVRHFQLEIAPADWDTIRRDTTNEIEVPASFRSDNEAPITVSVRRKSSRALPSEANPIKVSLKIDINEFVSGQLWHGLAKLSLENGGDISVLKEGMAWQLHEQAAQAGFYGPEAHPALANWVRVSINGNYVGVYTNVEQRDTQFMRNRGIYVKDQTWFYDVSDIDSWVLETGDPHSPAFNFLCYRPFGPPVKKGKTTTCPTPGDAALLDQLDAMIETDAMLAQGAVDAFSDNPDALFSHAKNFLFMDFAHSGLKRRYVPWDLDAVFRDTKAGIYGRISRRSVTQSDYERIILNHPAYRVRYNAIMTGLVASGGPLSATNVHALIDAIQPGAGARHGSRPLHRRRAIGHVQRIEGLGFRAHSERARAGATEQSASTSELRSQPLARPSSSRRMTLASATEFARPMARVSAMRASSSLFRSLSSAPRNPCR